jgi:ribosomal protein S18 acetylase RimI-like enzyme
MTPSDTETSAAQADAGEAGAATGAGEAGAAGAAGGAGEAGAAGGAGEAGAAGGGNGVSIAPLGAAQLAEVEPLWRSLIGHIRELDSVVELVPHELSWPRRLAIYEGLLADGESFALGARRAGRLVGYAVMHVAPPDAVWSTGARYAELTSLCVAAEERGGGLGTALLDAAEARLAARGIDQYVIGVDTVNEGAQRFYEKRGFRDGFHLMHGWIGGRAGGAASGAAAAPTGAGSHADAAPGVDATPHAGGAPDTPESIMRGID